jgi:hypothetical protein
MCSRLARMASASILSMLFAYPASAADPASPTVSFDPVISFDMTPSAGAASCLPHAKASVQVVELGPVEEMTVTSSDLPANTDFVIFIIQVPNAPFGLTWYQGDIPTNEDGVGNQTFRGRFNIGTFIVAPGAAPAPVVHADNASTNPATPPIQLYHVGMWFADPADAAKAGCPGTKTPFDSDHVGGIQVLNTATFSDDAGPLRFLDPSSPALIRK